MKIQEDCKAMQDVGFWVLFWNSKYHFMNATRPRKVRAFLVFLVFWNFNKCECFKRKYIYKKNKA